jgi:GDPmannose 4,6-dehydratase
VARIALGLQDQLFMGNLDAKRDWGHAKDYVEAMWLMLQHDTPEDFVIATGTTTAVRDFIKLAFEEAGIEIAFEGSGVDEKGIVVSCSRPDCKLQKGSVVVQVDPRYFRPTEVELLLGDATKAFEKLNWKPRYDLAALIKEMVASDLELFRKDKYLKEGGHKVFNYHE